MKKILFSMLSLLVAMTMFAQSESTRTMRIVYNGEVVFSRDVSLIDSITFMKETIDEMQLPYVPLPGDGKTTVVLHIPENTPRGCYAVGTMNGWDINNTDFMFTPVVGAQSERWVACTFDYNYSEDWYDGLRMKVIAIPSDPNASLSWDFQWGRNSSSGWADNVILLDGIGNFDYDYGYNEPPVLIDLENNGIVYMDVRDWYNSPIVQLNPAGLATFHVTVPNNTPANAIISIVGGFAENAWTLGAYLLTRQNDGSYYGQFEIPANFEYKYVVGLEGVEWSWDNSETLGTRKMPVDLHANDTIESWNSIPEPILPGTAGADLASPIVHDFSVTTDNTYPDFTKENTRSSDFDGEYVLVVSRADAETPTHHLLKVSDLLKGNINKIELSKEGIEGGTHVVSAGCLSHGHIYICNLTTDLRDGENLKVYHYASPEATPEVWSWDGNLGIDEFGNIIHSVPRLGDNISVNLDENGNGYAFFCGQEGSAEKMYRIQITNFNQFSNPTEIILEQAFPYYGKVNQVDEDRYLLTSHYMASTWLIDKDGNPLVDIYFQSTAAGLRPQTGEDPHVVQYNGKTYLIFASPYTNMKRLGVGPALYMIDITEGTQVDIQTALQNLSDILWEDEDGIWEPDFHYSLDVLNIEAESRKTVAACAAQCNAAVVNGKLLVYAAATGAGFVIIEFPAKSETPETPENPDEPEIPTESIGVFSVAEGKIVTFAPGNLQYTHTTNTWSFASTQYEIFGTGNVINNPRYDPSLSNKIDLFGWSTAATNFGASTSTDYNDYSGSFVDWGANKIGNDAPNTWRTLTNDEWSYLRYYRTNANELVGVAQVNGVNGLVFLPDNWTCPAGITFKSGFHSSSGTEYYADYQTFTANQWSKLESAGAVFLPAAGDRLGLNVYDVQYLGYYWSIAEPNSYYAGYFYFNSGVAEMGIGDRYCGHSVRLVKDL